MPVNCIVYYSAAECDMTTSTGERESRPFREEPGRRSLGPYFIHGTCTIHGQESSTCWSSTLRRRRRLPNTVYCTTCFVTFNTLTYLLTYCLFAGPLSEYGIRDGDVLLLQRVQGERGQPMAGRQLSSSVPSQSSSGAYHFIS